MSIQTIALNLLVPSKANVRRTDAKAGIEELAASIAAHGLRQNLNVSPLENGRFAVEAGERRRKALKLLVKQGKLAKDAPIPCLVLGATENASEISLVENTLRQPMHPDDQCEAFRAVIERDHMPVEDVAVRFGITATMVRQRLKLANVAPDLRALYRKGELTLEHMMALALSDDHIAQIQAWKSLPEWNRDPAHIRHYLTQEALPVTNKLVVLAGLDSYIAAGGAVLRDLFDDDDAGYATDRALVLRLVDAKLEEAMVPLRDEGWKWVIAELTRDYSTPYRRVYPQAAEDSNAISYAADDLARAGARIIVEFDGSLRIERGLVRSEDWAHDEAGEVAVDTSRQTRQAGPFSATLIEDLTAHRTAALRCELAANPMIALAATVHALALAHMYPTGGAASCLAIRADSERLAGHTTHVEDCAAHAFMEVEGERWGERLPGEAGDLWGWCLEQSQDVLLDLLAFLAALSVNAVQTKHDRPDGARLRHGSQLAEALALEMRDHWTPTGDGFFGRISKAGLGQMILEAGVQTGVQISALKKAEAAKHACKLLATASWLPEPLRSKRPAEPLSVAA